MGMPFNTYLMRTWILGVTRVRCLQNIYLPPYTYKWPWEWKASSIKFDLFWPAGKISEVPGDPWTMWEEKANSSWLNVETWSTALISGPSWTPARWHTEVGDTLGSLHARAHSVLPFLQQFPVLHLFISSCWATLKLGQEFSTLDVWLSPSLCMTFRGSPGLPHFH